MARAITWAIRIISPDGRAAFFRVGGKLGKGPIASFSSKETAEKMATAVRPLYPPPLTLEVIERSHGRRF